MHKWLLFLLLLTSFGANAAMYLPYGNTYVSDDQNYSYCTANSCKYRHYTESENVGDITVSGAQIFFYFDEPVWVKVEYDNSGPIFTDGFEFDGIYPIPLTLLIEPGLHTFRFRWLAYINDGYFGFNINLVNATVPIPPSLFLFSPALIGFMAYRKSKHRA